MQHALVNEITSSVVIYGDRNFTSSSSVYASMHNESYLEEATGLPAYFQPSSLNLVLSPHVRSHKKILF